MDEKPDSKMIRTAFAAMPFAAVLGLEMVEIGAEKVVACAPWTAERCTVGGVLHGGYLMAVADTVGAACAVMNMPAGAKTATIESKTNFMRAVEGGDIRAVATPVHAGRSTVVVQTDIFTGSGKLVSRTIQTQAVITPQ